MAKPRDGTKEDANDIRLKRGKSNHLTNVDLIRNDRKIDKQSAVPIASLSVMCLYNGERSNGPKRLMTQA